MQKQKTGIYGGAGAMGSFMAEVFSSAGYEISICDVNTEEAEKLAAENGYILEDGETLAKTSDIVMWSVPIKDTVPMINRYAPLMKEGSLATDVTSVKIEPVNALLNAVPEGVEVIGMHPMFRPTLAMEGQKVILTPASDDPAWMPALEKILEKEGAQIKKTTPEIHDGIMKIIQSMPHTTAIVSLKTIMDSGYGLEELMDYASPVYRLFLDLMIRITSGNPELYGNIQIHNPEVAPFLKSLASNLDEHIRSVEGKNMRSFTKSYLALKAFAERFAQSVNKRIDSMAGKPRGIELFFDRKHAEDIKRLVGRGSPLDYKGRVMTMDIKSGDLDKLMKSRFALARYVRYDQKETKEGTVAFYIRNIRIPFSGKMVRLTPMVTDNPERTKKLQPQFERVQMYNRYLDPFLNVLNTWERHEGLRSTWPFIAYRTPRGRGR